MLAPLTSAARRLRGRFYDRSLRSACANNKVVDGSYATASSFAAPLVRRAARRSSRDRLPATRDRWLRSSACGLLATRMPRAAARSGPPRSRPSRGASRCGAATTATWVALTTGERVCTGDALRSQSSSRATITLPDGGTSAARREQRAWRFPEPPSGLGSLIELLRGVIHVISRDPRSSAVHDAVRQRRPRGHRVRHSRRREQPSHRDRRARRRGRRDDTRGRAQRRRATMSRSRKTAKRRRRRRTQRRSSACAGRATTRRSSIVPLPGADQEPLAGAARRTPTSTRHRAAARLATARIEAAEADIADALRIAPRQRDGTVAERPARPRARATARPHATRSSQSASPPSRLGRRARGVVARRAELRSARGRRAHAARSARARARQRHRRRRGSPRSPWLEAMRGPRSPTPRAHGAWPRRKAPRSSCSASPTCARSIRPPPRALSQPPSSSSPTHRCRGSAWLLPRFIAATSPKGGASSSSPSLSIRPIR